MDVGKVIINRVDAFAKHQHASDANPENRGGAGNGQAPSHLPGREEIGNLVDKLNEKSHDVNARISFSFHEKTNQVIMKVLDSESNEIIREIPAKDVVRVAEHIQDTLGMFLDESR